MAQSLRVLRAPDPTDSLRLQAQVDDLAERYRASDSAMPGPVPAIADIAGVSIRSAIPPARIPTSLSELCGWGGWRFVQLAYRALLKREPDADGARNYLGALLAGRIDRLDLVIDMASSPEGQRAGALAFPGLAAARRRRRLMRVPIIGSVIASVGAVWRGTRHRMELEREIHRLWTLIQPAPESRAR